MKIEIPDHKAISLNQIYEQKHWNIRKEIADEAHELVWAYLPRDKEMFEDRVDIKITAYYKHKYRKDSSNVCAKVYEDALKGRLIEDDDTRFVRWVGTRAVIGAEEDKVVIEIEEIKEDKDDKFE